MLRVALQAGDEPVGYYESNPRRTKQIAQRVTKRVFDGVEFLAQLWTAMEKIKTGDSEAEVTAGDVVNRLLELGLDSAFAEVGVPRPQTKEQLEKVVAAVEKQMAASNSSRSK